MSTVNFTHELGDTLREKVSGLEGVVMARAQYSTGCIHYGIQSRGLKDGETRGWEWFDQSRLESVSSATVNFDISKGSASGPLPVGPQEQTPCTK